MPDFRWKLKYQSSYEAPTSTDGREFTDECPTVNTECDIIIPEYDEAEQQLDDDFWDNYFDNLSPYEID